MDDPLLSLLAAGEDHLCPDCRSVTVFLPVDAVAWVCTSCDLALVRSDVPAARADRSRRVA